MGENEFAWGIQKLQDLLLNMSMLRGNYIVLKNDIAVSMGSRWDLNIAGYHNSLKIVYYNLKIYSHD